MTCAGRSDVEIQVERIFENVIKPRTPKKIVARFKSPRSVDGGRGSSCAVMRSCDRARSSNNVLRTIGGREAGVGHERTGVRIFISATDARDIRNETKKKNRDRCRFIEPVRTSTRGFANRRRTGASYTHDAVASVSVFGV